MEQKIEFDADCFGTIDKENKESCSHCNYSDQCSQFKPKLAEIKEAAVQNHLDKKQQEKQKMADEKTAHQNHMLVSLIIFLVIGLVFWMLLKGEV